MIADHGDRRLLAEFLERSGYRVHACSGSHLKSDDFAGSLIITDEMHARQFGVALFDLRQRQRPLYLPALVMIGTRAPASQWLRSGFDDVLRMPLNKDELLVRLQAFLKLRKHSEDAHKESEHFIVSTLDALSEHICVSDFDGNILLVNQAWRNFAAANGWTQNLAWNEANYFAVCEASVGRGSEDALMFVDGMRAVASGARSEFSFEYSCDSPTEKRWFLAKVTRFTWNNAAVLVISHENISVTRLAENKLDHLAHYDSLTGLANRAYFYDSLSRTLLQAKRSKWIVGVLFIDLDHFKMINDTLGHSAGDEVLREVSNRLTNCLRASDVVGRLGGDEFCAYLPALAQEQDAGLIAEKIVAALAAPIMINDTEAFVTASIGVVLYPNDGIDIDALLNAADTAMYWAKELGRSNYQFFTPSMNDAALARANIVNGLRHALERNEFFLVYQPQLDLKSGRIRGCEALIRWRDPERGIVSPAAFIPIAEETGLIIAIGEWALKTACAQNKAWQEAGRPGIVVAVNLSARQFRQNELADTVCRALQETGLEGKYLELEVTESIVMADVDKIIRTMQQIKSMGVRLSIDDFGTGYSNLGYLRNFPLDAIKVDKSFVSDIGNGTGQVGGDIVNMIITLGHNLRLEVIAEGVETNEQMAFLAAAGCDMVQGYHFSRPLFADDMLDFLRSSRFTSL